MPKVRWNSIGADDVDGFDRSRQFTPYDGPIPPNAVYQWKIKTLKYAPATADTHDQLRIGLELVPRKGRNEQRYAGYFLMLFIHITPKTQFKYVPFLDAIGVDGRAFAMRTIIDQDGNITSIGKWRNTGNQLIKGQLRDAQEYQGETRKELGWMGPPSDDDDEWSSEDSEEYVDEEDSDEFDEDADDDEEYEDEGEPF